MVNHQGLILRVYLYLIILTLTSAYIGSIDNVYLQGMEGVAVTGILTLTLLKGLQIVDVYMELKQAPRLWRNLLRAYVVLLPFTIGMIYILF